MDLTVGDISRVKTGTPEEKRALLDHFLKARSPAGVQLALEALGDSDWTIRRYASDLLAGLGAPAIEHLGKVLGSGDENQRYWAVQSLVKIGRDSVPLLLKILARGPKSMRIHAASALGQIDDPTAIPYLVTALADSAWPVRYNAFEGLSAFGEKALPELTKGLDSDNEDRAYWCAKALGKLGESARDVLLQALKGGNRRLRFVIAAALGETGDRRVIRVLINSTKDRSWIVRRRSSDALAEIGPTAIPLILEALQAEDEEQVRWLLAALCKMGERGRAALGELLIRRGEAFAWNVKDGLVELGAAARPLFLELGQHEDIDLRFFAVTCLGELGPDPAVNEQLVASLKDPSWSIRKVAAEALASLGPLIRDQLMRAMEYGNEDLRYWVTVVFRKMGPDGVDQLIEALQDSNSNVGYFAATALAEVKERRVVRPLIRALASDSWPVRNAASTSLSILGEFAVEQLVNSIEDEHEDVSFWVAKTLRRIGRPAVPEVVRLLRKGTDEQRIYAAKTLGVLRDPQAFAALREALKDGHEWVRLFAAVAIGEIGGEQAVEPLLGMLQDPTFRIHPRLVEVFGRIGDRVTPDLLNMAASGEAGARANSTRVLGALRVRSAVAPTIETARDTEAPLELRLACVAALGSHGAVGHALATLSDLASEDDEAKVRRAAVVALGDVEDDAAILPLLRAGASSGQHEDETRVTNLLHGRGPSILPNLVEALAHKDVGIRQASATVLERFGGAALPYLKPAQNEPDQNVRFWAKKLVKKLQEQVVRT